MLSKSTRIKYTVLFKDFLLASRVLQIFQPLNGVFHFLYNFNNLTSWVHKHKKDNLLMNDMYKPVRNYDNRLNSFEAIIKTYNLAQSPITYLEFGVSSGLSFKWWLQHSTNPNSRFHGFDTFEGLPEKWGAFDKGDMISPIPEVNDSRAHFYKGMFQDTLNDFLFKNGSTLKNTRKIIHMDADIFSATLFALSQLYPYLQKGDIIMFDEFNVYGHEFKAFQLFTECFYVKLKLISVQNNFYHAAFEVE